MSITATITTADIERLAGGIIKIPVVLSTTDASMCQVEVLPDSAIVFAARSGESDLLDGIEHAVYFKSFNNFDVYVQIPAGRRGGFNIDIDGNAFCRVMNRTARVVSAVAQDISYDLRLPDIVDTITPSVYEIGKHHYIIWKFGPKITLANPTTLFNSEDATFLDLFDFSGADLGVPTIYTWTGTDNPEIPPPFEPPDDMPDADPVLQENWKAATLTSDESDYIMMFWKEVIETATGFVNIRIKTGVVLGPVV